MEQTPEKLTMSLRAVMIRGLLKEWRTRLQAFQGSEESRATAQRMQWLDSLGHWNHMHWCPTKQDLVLTEKTESQSVNHRGSDDQDRRAGDTHHGRLYQELQVHSPAQGVEWVQFLIEVQIRGPGDKLWTFFNELIGSAALHLLAARLRRDRHPFSGLADKVSKHSSGKVRASTSPSWISTSLRQFRKSQLHHVLHEACCAAHPCSAPSPGSGCTWPAQPHLGCHSASSSEL